ncbi:unnamed protein product [Ectocarpus sp. 12 AP-2014]
MKVHPDFIEEPVDDEKVETVDLEALDGPANIFAQEYGADTMTQARENRERLARITSKTNKHAVDPGLQVGTNARLSHFEKEKLYQNDWNNSVLDLMENLLYECTQSSKAHAEAARGCRRKYRMLMIPSIIVATAATSASFFAAGGSPCGEDGGSDDDGLKYVVASLTALVGIMSGIASVYNFKSKMSENIAASGAFANLARRCKIICFLPIHLKPNSEVALTDISAEQAHLTSSSPLL